MWLHHFGINWAALRYASWLLFWLSLGATALYVGTMLVIDGVGILKLGSDSSFPGTSKTYLRAQKAKQRVNEWAPGLAMFIVGYVLGQASVFSPVRELHNVEVLHKDHERVYTVNIPAIGNPPRQQDVVMTFRLCEDGDDLPLKAGMVMDPFQYIQKDGCFLINRDTDVDFRRNSRRDVVDKNNQLLFAKEN